MAVTEPTKTIYPFAEKFTKDTSTTTAVSVWTIPAGAIITMVLAEVGVAATGSANNIIVGDTDDDNGYITALSICGATVGTIFGDSAKERGVYLTLDETTGIHAGHWKVYTSASTLTMTASASATTEATMNIYVFGYKYK